MAGGGPSKGYGGYDDYSLLSSQPSSIGSTGGDWFTPEQWDSFGKMMSIGGALTSTVGTYYSALAQQYQLKSQALELDYQSKLAGINSQMAEADAAAAFEAGKREVGRIGMEYRQIEEATRTRSTAAGIEGGVGSAREVQTSIEFAKKSDQQAVEMNTARAVGAAWTRAADYRNRGRMASVGAENSRSMADTISPWGRAGTSLFASAGEVSRQWAYTNRRSSNGES